jgi:subtilisin family serine protease
VYNANRGLLMAVASRPDVTRITANHRFQLSEPLRQQETAGADYAIEPNLVFVHADEVWAMGYTGQGMVMAANDTGFQWDHPALMNQYRGWDGVTADHNYNWWDATGGSPNVPADGHGHGTHVTGIMVGDDGGSNQIGIAPGAQTIHCKMLDNAGFSNDAWIEECFEWDLAPWDLDGLNPDPSLAPQAINLAWRLLGSDPAFEDEIAALMAAGIAVEVGTGGGGPGCGTLRSPADYEQSLTTGAVDDASGILPGTISSFSGRGPSPLYPDAFMPDVMAPGVSVRSAVPGAGYENWSGTSMAVSHVTGLVALMWSAGPELQGNVTSTIQIIVDTAVPLSGQVGACGGDYSNGPNNDWGYGTIDALAAVEEALQWGGATAGLEGAVFDANSGDPLVAAFQVSGPGDYEESFSGQNYALTVVPGYYTFTVGAAGYLTVSTSLEATQGVTITHNFNLQPVEQEDWILYLPVVVLNNTAGGAAVEDTNLLEDDGMKFSVSGRDRQRYQAIKK